MTTGTQISVLPASPALVGTELVPVVTVGTITGITQASSAVVTISNISAACPFSIGQQAYFSGVLGMTQINTVSGAVSATAGVSGNWTITVGVNSSAFSAYTSGGLLTTTVQTTTESILPLMTQSQVGFALYPRTVLEIAAGVVPVNYAYAPGWISRYGTNSVPGTTDMSVPILNMLAANGGGVCYIDSLCFMAGITITSTSVGYNNGIGSITTINSQMNGTEIRFVGTGEMILKPQPGSGSSPTGFNFDSTIWVGIAIQGCDRVRIVNAKFNGNRSNQLQYEGVYCLAICGSTNIYIDRPQFREFRGDGLYIDWLSPIHSSGQANSQRIFVTGFFAENTVTDGRNACSIISCNQCVINGFESYNVGGTINGVLEPGGLDLEPNWPAQTISDVVINAVNVYTAGGNGICVSGMSISGNDANEDWNCQRISVNGRLFNTASGYFLLKRCVDSTARVDVYHTNLVIAAQIDYANRCDVELNIAVSSVGLWLGALGFVTDSSIRVNVNGYGGTGFGAIMTTGLTRTTIRGKVYNAAAGSNAPCILLDNNSRTVTQTYAVYSVDCPFDPNANAVINNSGVTIGTGTFLKDCTMTGFSYATQATFQIPSYNCIGRNIATGVTVAPTTGTWAQFDEVVLDQTAGATIPRAKCIAGGSPGTWKTYGVLST
jgi:hypothetical protein